LKSAVDQGKLSRRKRAAPRHRGGGHSADSRFGLQQRPGLHIVAAIAARVFVTLGGSRAPHAIMKISRGDYFRGRRLSFWWKQTNQAGALEWSNGRFSKLQAQPRIGKSIGPRSAWRCCSNIANKSSSSDCRGRGAVHSASRSNLITKAV